jgi:pSer/pThr/pTyr-binding forkhead associated (FHA) protein
LSGCVLADADPLAPHALAPREVKALLDAERAGEPFLAYKDAEGRLVVFRPVPAEQPLTLGRRPETDLAIDWDNEVSGLHAELQDIAGEWTIVDDGLSSNGTFVNARRIAGRRRLRDGDRVRVGRTILVYRAGRRAAVAATSAAGEPGPEPRLTATQRNVLIALCRPYRDGAGFSTPATNQQIAEELFLSVEAVKMHLRTLFGKFELGALPQNEKRARLAECVLQLGVISRKELG